MAILDKHGKVYELRGPNPILETQTPWDRDQIELINMHEDGREVLKDKKTDLQRAAERVFDIGRIIQQRPISAKQFMEEIKAPVEEPKPEPPPPEPEKVPEPPPPPEPQPQRTTIPEKVQKAAVRLLCVPVVMVRIGTSKLLQSRFGDKFSFEGVILNQEDLNLKFWTTTKIKDGSIIYPQTLDKRWWKVVHSQPSANGWIYDSVPSNLNPDFS